jgi:hypothetical protein
MRDTSDLQATSNALLFGSVKQLLLAVAGQHCAIGCVFSSCLFVVVLQAVCCTACCVLVLQLQHILTLWLVSPFD